MNVIIFDNGNGISIVMPTGEVPFNTILESCPDGSVVIDSQLLPDNRDFRDAWELINDAVEVNFTKAQDITKDRLRAEREPLLIAQDVAYMKALEQGADTAAIVSEKERLRNVTDLVDNCTTLDELRGLSCQQ